MSIHFPKFTKISAGVYLLIFSGLGSFTWQLAEAEKHHEASCLENKKALNHLHETLAYENERYIDDIKRQADTDLTQHNDSTRKQANQLQEKLKAVGEVLDAEAGDNCWCKKQPEFPCTGLFAEAAAQNNFLHRQSEFAESLRFSLRGNRRLLDTLDKIMASVLQPPLNSMFAQLPNDQKALRFHCIQAQNAVAMNYALRELVTNMEHDTLTVHYTPVISLKREYCFRVGEPVQGAVFLAAMLGEGKFRKTVDIRVNGKAIPMERGLGRFSTKLTSPGRKIWQVEASRYRLNGDTMRYTKDFETDPCN